jgi:hypothetical protein
MKATRAKTTTGERDRYEIPTELALMGRYDLALKQQVR